MVDVERICGIERRLGYSTEGRLTFVRRGDMSNSSMFEVNARALYRPTCFAIVSSDMSYSMSAHMVRLGLEKYHRFGLCYLDPSLRRSKSVESEERVADDLLEAWESGIFRVQGSYPHSSDRWDWWTWSETR